MAAGLWFSSTNSSSLEKESDFDRLVQSLIPTIPMKPIPEGCIKDFNTMFNPKEEPIRKYFTMLDLWQSYEKWSAYGTKTAVLLDNGHDVDQCFYPSLSAIQIFTNQSPETMSLEKERSFENSSEDYMNSSPTSDSKANLYFEFNEKDSPYRRYPLYRMVKNLAKKKQGLMTLTSIDFSTASWMAVACAIVNSLFTDDVRCISFLYAKDTHEEVNGISGLQNYNKSGVRSVTLHPFGFATCKFNGDGWLNHGDSDVAKLYDLNGAADSWIKQLSYYHHDYMFFTKQDEYAPIAIESSTSYYDGYASSF